MPTSRPSNYTATVMTNQKPENTVARGHTRERVSINRLPINHGPIQLLIEDGTQLPWRCERPAVLVGHPGHELRVLGWLAEKRPRVHVLTDGSGTTGYSRVPATSDLLRRIRARRGEVFGLLSDADIYRAILHQDIPLFCSIVDRLAASLAYHGTDFLAADAAEGFNPAHDICRQIANAAICRAQMMTGRSIANYEFLLAEWDLNGTQGHDGGHDHRCWHLRLEDRLLRLKLDAARDYAEMKDEVERAIALKGEEYFRLECLMKVTGPFLESRQRYRPYYEQLGERRVAAGKYSYTIRYESHMAPLLSAIWEHATGHQRPKEVEPAIKAMKAAP
jgi:hypothetical protein